MFGKLFASMYDGTLATRGPWQALVTFQQMIVLCDRTGIVDMTADALSRRTTIPLDIIKIGITALEQPDSESRSPELDGRRIVRLSGSRDWGWQIVNHDKYRKIRSEDERREYMANLMRERRANEKKDVINRKQPLAKLAHADADAVNPLAPSGAFEQFWSAYPRKKSKGQAEKAWKAHANGNIEPIMAGLQRAIASTEWAKDNGKFIPYPATWLNAKGWLDEAPTPAAALKPFVV